MYAMKNIFHMLCIILYFFRSVNLIEACVCNSGCCSDNPCGDVCFSSSCESTLGVPNNCQSGLPKGCACHFTNCKASNNNKCSGYVLCSPGSATVCSDNMNFLLNGSMCMAVGATANLITNSSTKGVKVCQIYNVHAPTKCPTVAPTSACVDEINFAGGSRYGTNIGLCGTWTFPYSHLVVNACGYNFTKGVYVPVQLTVKDVDPLVYPNEAGLGLSTGLKNIYEIGINGLVQIEVSNISPSSNPQFMMGSTDNIELYCIYGSQDAGILGNNLLMSSAIEGQYTDFPVGYNSYRYLSFTACGSNSNPLADVLIMKFRIYNSVSCLTTEHPTFLPSASPSMVPSNIPSIKPSMKPSITPTFKPTSLPPTQKPSSPTVFPSMRPSRFPATRRPSVMPSMRPSFTPTVSFAPTTPTFAPSVVPSITPSVKPSHRPSYSPTMLPTIVPSFKPTSTPSADPTFAPTKSKRYKPTVLPTSAPSYTPSNSQEPSCSPLKISTYIPTTAPSSLPISLHSSFTPSLTPTSTLDNIECPAPYSGPSIVPADPFTTSYAYFLANQTYTTSSPNVALNSSVILSVINCILHTSKYVYKPDAYEITIDSQTYLGDNKWQVNYRILYEFIVFDMIKLTDEMRRMLKIPKGLVFSDKVSTDLNILIPFWSWCKAWNNSVTTNSFFNALINHYDARAQTSEVYLLSSVPSYLGPYGLAPTSVPTSAPTIKGNAGASQFSGTDALSATTKKIIVPVILAFLLLCCCCIALLLYKRFKKRKDESETAMLAWFEAGKGDLQIFKKYFTKTEAYKAAPAATDEEPNKVKLKRSNLFDIVRDNSVYQPDIYDLYQTKKIISSSGKSSAKNRKSPGLNESSKKTCTVDVTPKHQERKHEVEVASGHEKEKNKKVLTRNEDQSTESPSESSISQSMMQNVKKYFKTATKRTNKKM